MKEKREIKVNGIITNTDVGFDEVIKHLKRTDSMELNVYYCARRKGWWSNGSYIGINAGSAYKKILKNKHTLFAINTHLFQSNNDKIMTRMPDIEFCIPDRYAKNGWVCNTNEILAEDWQTFIIDHSGNSDGEIYLKM